MVSKIPLGKPYLCWSCKLFDDDGDECRIDGCRPLKEVCGEYENRSTVRI